MEDKVVTISHAKGSLTFSANFQLIAAMNPCPYGWLNDPQKACGRASAVVTKYHKRISGPILDRIDIHIEVPRVDYEKLSGARVGESSESVCVCLRGARDIQRLFFIAPIFDKREIGICLGGCSAHIAMTPLLMKRSLT
jgi:magnesium chelatase family protein